MDIQLSVSGSFAGSRDSSDKGSRHPLQDLSPEDCMLIGNYHQLSEARKKIVQKLLAELVETTEKRHTK